MSEKVYQLTANQFGNIEFSNEEQWYIVHICYPNLNLRTQSILNNLVSAENYFVKLFGNWLLPILKTESENSKLFIMQLFNLLSTKYRNQFEKLANFMYEKYESLEFKNNSIEELIINNYEFCSLGIIKIASENNGQFSFDNFHVSIKSLNRILTIDFWSKIKKDSVKITNKNTF